MCFQPKNPSGGARIDANLLPPSSFVTAAMHFAVMSPAKWDSKLITDLTTKHRGLRKLQVMGVGRTPAADQASLLGHRFDMLAIAHAALCR